MRMRPNLKVTVLVLWLVSLHVPGLAAEATIQASRKSIDHAAACGFLQLRKEFQRAIEHCDEALRHDPANDQVLSNRGSAHYALGHFDHALRDFDAAMLLLPQNARNFFNRALVHAARKDHRRAIEDYDQAIKLMPNLAIAYNNRALEFEATGERDKAISDYREALRLSPTLGPVVLQSLRRLGAER